MGHLTSLSGTRVTVTSPAAESTAASAEGREVDHRAPNQGRGDFERSTPGRDGRQDVVVFAQLEWRDARVPMEDLQIPRAPGVAHLGRDEVEYVAARPLVR